MYKIYRAQKKDAEEIYKLMEQVHKQMENPSMYICDDLEFVKRHIEDEGFILIAVADEIDTPSKIVASLIVRYPGQAEDNLGRECHLSSEQLNAVVHMESAVVAKSFRGHGLQRQLMKTAERFVEEEKLIYLMGTVSPDNIASCQNFEKSGYRHIATKEKYGGYMRRIYCKTIQR